MTLLLSCKSIGKAFGPRPLFRDISIAFDDTERTGLIGPNGSGKSTLLKILAGLEAPDTGTIETRRQLRLGYLAQEDKFPPQSTARDVLTAARLAAHPDGHEDEHDRELRADILLSKLAFGDPLQVAETLSGGWRKRLSIARELIGEPDLLLLDEPTNHLDIEGILWLEDLLASAPFAFVLVSHDRYFLENVTNRTVELNEKYPDGYLSANGSYGQFLERREGFLVAQSAREQALASRVRREVEWLQRGAKARRTKAKGRIEQAGRMMEELSDLKSRNAPGGAAAVDFVGSGRQTRKLLVTKKVSKAIADRPLFGPLDLTLSPGMRLGLLGPNGSGKSTLLRVMAGSVAADAGEVWRAEGLRVVLFDQTRESIDRKMTLRDALSPTGETVSFRGNSLHVSAWAAQFLFRKEQLDLAVGDLSGGEQARVLIARLMLKPADVLILDEPTNDLDIPTLEVLEESLADFPGALVLVTHDRYLIDRVATDLLALDGRGGANPYASLAQWEAAMDAVEQARVQAIKAASRKAAPKAAAEGPKRLTYMEQRELEQIEEKIMAAEEALQTWQKRLEDPVTLANRDKLHDACVRVDEAQNAVTSLYSRWEELEARKR